MKPRASKAKFYTIHRDASEALAPISRGEWVNPRGKETSEDGIDALSDTSKVDDTNKKQEEAKTPSKVGLESTVADIDRDYLSVKNATSASRSRWFRGY